MLTPYDSLIILTITRSPHLETSFRYLIIYLILWLQHAKSRLGLSRVHFFVLHGWPSENTISAVQPYFNCNDEFSVVDGCVLWGARVVIPPQGQHLVLQQLHDTHLGINRMKSLAHSYVWWPGIDTDITTAVQQCEVCQVNRPSPTKAPLHPWEWPSRPWSGIHIDHAGPFQGKLFLITIDAHSKWMDVHVVSSTSAEVTIAKLRSVFAIPNK